MGLALDSYDSLAFCIEIQSQEIANTLKLLVLVCHFEYIFWILWLYDCQIMFFSSSFDGSYNNKSSANPLRINMASFLEPTSPDKCCCTPESSYLMRETHICHFREDASEVSILLYCVTLMSTRQLRAHMTLFSFVSLRLSKALTRRA